MKKCFLSIETSLNRIFLVLYFNEKLYSLQKQLENSVEVEINKMLEAILIKGKAKFTDLNILFVSLGPGSYTGTRVGLAAAKAIAVSINKPLLGYTNFEVIYNQSLIEGYINKKSILAILIKANKYECYYQEVNKNNFGKIKVMKLKEFKIDYNSNRILIGNCFKSVELDKYNYCLPKKEAIFDMYRFKLKSEKKNNKELEPLYIKGHYAEK